MELKNKEKSFSDLGKYDEVMKIAETIKLIHENRYVIQYHKIFECFILVLLKEGSKDASDGYIRRFFLKEIDDSKKDSEILKEFKNG